MNVFLNVAFIVHLVWYANKLEFLSKNRLKCISTKCYFNKQKFLKIENSSHSKILHG